MEYAEKTKQHCVKIYINNTMKHKIEYKKSAIA